MKEDRRLRADRRRVTRGGRRGADPRPVFPQVPSHSILATVLVVDRAVDEMDLRLLEASGYLVVTAGARDAAVVAAHRRPDVVVIDPATGLGWDAYAELRRTSSEIPLILLASSAASAHVHRCLARDTSNRTVVVATPCSCANLATVIERVRHGQPAAKMNARR